MLDFLMAHKVEVIGAMLALSEVLALIPGMPSGILAGVISILKSLKGPSA